MIDYVYNNNYYALNKQVIRFLLKNKEDIIVNDFETKNYSTIKQSKLDNLIEYVDDNLNEYVTSVYLEIETNTAETEDFYIKLLNSNKISFENIVKIVGKTETVIKKINDIENIEIIKLFLKESKVLASWNNLVDIYIRNENEFIEEMTSFINVKENSKELSRTKINYDISNEEIVKKFLISLLLNDDIENKNYSDVLSSVPYIYNSLKFESLSFDKVKLLINKNKLTTNSTNYNLLRENFEELHIMLIENNPNKFISEIDLFEIENEELLSLLESKKISIQHKEIIIENYETSTFTLDSKLLTQIGKLLLENNNLNINSDIVRTVGTDGNLGELDKIRLFNKWNRIYDDIADISTFLISLGRPYSSISENGKRPLLDNNDINRVFVENLKLKGYISKYEIEKKKGIRISTFRNR